MKCSFAWFGGYLLAPSALYAPPVPSSHSQFWAEWISQAKEINPALSHSHGAPRLENTLEKVRKKPLCPGTPARQCSIGGMW